MNYELEKVPCNFCGSDDYSIYIKDAKELYNRLEGTFSVVKCNHCGFKFTNPRPTRETIGYFYPDTAGYYRPEKPKRPLKIKDRIFRSVLSNYYGYCLERLPKLLDFYLYLYYKLKRKIYLSHIPLFVHGGRLFDIGCSWGKYLHSMKNLGWEVYGIEFNKNAVAYAAGELGLNVAHGSIDDLNYEDDFFDVVHMSMVLEHLHDPLGALLKVNRILKAGGQLLLSVPDISGFEAAFFKNKSYTLQVPQHLNHFTPETIRCFLKRSGFITEKIVHQYGDTDIIKSAWHLENKILYNILKIFPVRKLLLRPLIRALSLLGKTSRMTIYAKKQLQAYE